MKKINLIVTLVILAGFFGWSGYNQWDASRVVVIDNPTGQQITFQLNGTDYSIDAGGKQTIHLDEGEHTLKIGEEEKKFTKPVFTFKWSMFAGRSKQLSVLNPTESTYILWHEVYGKDLTEEKVDSLLPTYDCEIDGEPDTCNHKEIDDLYFESVVDYTLDQHFPDEVKMSRGASYVLRSKLFRLDDFIAYIEE